MPPPDMRYLLNSGKSESSSLTGAGKPDAGRSRVFSFQEGVYHSQAENLPDVRDSTMDEDDLISIHVPLAQDPDECYRAAGLAQSKPQRDKKKNRFKKSVQVDPKRAELEVRYLPPGRMMDIYEQMKLVDPEVPSFSCFWRTWIQSFPHLRFRDTSSHSVCGVCTHHKLMIRELSCHLKAQKVQRQHYLAHLSDQFRDRQAYWRARGLSRQKPTTAVTLIVDSMDQLKFVYPRGQVYKTKELSTMVRPRCHVTAIIIHGFSLTVSISPHDLRKDSSTMVELLSHSLTRLRDDFDLDLSRLSVCVQCDNTTRETKNNVCLRWLSTLVGNGIPSGVWSYGVLFCRLIA